MKIDERFWGKQKFCNIMLTNRPLRMLLPHNSWRWRTTLAWYSPSATRQICLHGLEHSHRIHGFRLTWFCLFVEVLIKRANFLERFGYRSVTNWTIAFRTTNVFCHLQPSSNSLGISSRIRQRRTFIYTAP